MDKRDILLEILNKYKSVYIDEVETCNKFISFVEDNPRCFENDLESGHVTGSSLVVDENIEFTLLTHHAKINKWLQFGGHSDGSSDVIQTGFREAQEESGLTKLRFIPGHEEVIDIDIHEIPQKGSSPLHYHYDVRIILQADINEPFSISSESKDLKWVKLEDVFAYNSQPSFLRLINKAMKFRSISK